MFSNFSYELKKIINDSKKEMKKLGHYYVGTEHFLLALLNTNNNISNILLNHNITYDLIKNKIIEHIGVGMEHNSVFVLTPLFKKVIEQSIIITNEYKKDKVEIDTVFQSMLEIGEGVAYRILCDLNINIDDLYEEVRSVQRISDMTSFNDIGCDLTNKAKNNMFDPVIGREKEIDNIIEVLLRKNKRNPLLIGDAGVGKTAIVEELANRIVTGNVPYKLMNKRIISISMSSLVAGTKYRGEFEEKVLNIVKELESNNNLILFIDEIHTLVGAGGAEGAIDASNILKPALSRGNITVIGAITIQEYRKYIEEDKALSRRFQKVLIDEPDEKDLFNILNKVKTSYERYHNVLISNDVIKHIIKVSKKYLFYRKEPDRSLDILDEVSSMKSSMIDKEQSNINKLKKELLKYQKIKKEMINTNNFEGAIKYRKRERLIESKINNSELSFNIENDIKYVTKNDIDELISKKYNVVIGVSKVIKNVLAKQKISPKAKCTDVSNIVDCCKDIFISDKEITKPVSILLNNNLSINLITYLSNHFFNNNLIEIDLNDYKDESSINKLIGAPPGYIGYNNKHTVFESLKEKPIAIIVFNNYESANNKIKELITDILKRGYINDSTESKISFLNTLIIINSKDMCNKPIGFNSVKINNSLDLSKYVTKTIDVNINEKIEVNN